MVKITIPPDAELFMASEILQELRHLSDRLLTLETTFKVQRTEDEKFNTWKLSVDKHISDVDQHMASQDLTNKILAVVGTGSVLSVIGIIIQLVIGG